MRLWKPIGLWFYLTMCIITFLKRHKLELYEKRLSLCSKFGNKLCFLNCLINLRYKESSSISNHLDEFQGFLGQLSRMDINFDDEVLGLWLLNTPSES